MRQPWGKSSGYDLKPYALAQYLAVGESFADQWQPQGGIESAMIEMLAVAFSLQMCWSGIAHDLAREHMMINARRSSANASSGWKSPYQTEADAVDQEHRLADGYNQQFVESCVNCEI